MIKIAHTTTVYSSFVSILYSKLKALNSYHDIDLTIISAPRLKGDNREPPAKFIPLNMERSIKPLADLISIWRLYKILKKEKFDIVHSHNSKAGFITTAAAKMARVPVILHTYHGLPFYEGQKKLFFLTYRFLDKLVCRYRDHVFSQNRGDLPKIVQLIGAAERATYEGNGIDVDFVEQSAARQLPQALRDYRGDGFKILILSRLEPVKRVADFIKAVHILVKDGINVSCIIAGGGPLKQNLEKMTEKMNLNHCVKFAGNSYRAPGLILAGDLVVLCSAKEGLPRSLLEAMVLEKPVVATDVAGTRELVVDGQTGYLVPLGDSDRLAEKIKYLINNESLQKKFGAAGRNRVLQHHNDIKISQFLHDFYLVNFRRFLSPYLPKNRA